MSEMNHHNNNGWYRACGAVVARPLRRRQSTFTAWQVSLKGEGQEFNPPHVHVSFFFERGASLLGFLTAKCESSSVSYYLLHGISHNRYACSRNGSFLELKLDEESPVGFQYRRAHCTYKVGSFPQLTPSSST